MTAWTAFAVVTGIVVVLLLVLSRQSAAMLEEFHDSDADQQDRDVADRPESSVEAGRAESDIEADRSELGSEDEPIDRPDAHSESRNTGTGPGELKLTTTALLANVVFSQGLFALILVVAIWLASVPLSSLGVTAAAFEPAVLGFGAVAGIVIYVLNEFAATHARRWGLSDVDRLRQLLAPDSIGGWVLLMVVVLPIIAIFEELLFRGILIGAFSVGFDISPWVLAVGSSIVFGLGHGAQGRAGVIVTGGLGLALAWLFIVTESLIAVVVAHYVVNAMEFIVHEGLDVQWLE